MMQISNEAWLSNGWWWFRLSRCWMCKRYS